MAEWPEDNGVAVVGAKTITIAVPKPNFKFVFHQLDGNGWGNGPVVGSLDFNGPEMKFEGNAEESAKVFFDYVAKCFDQRLKMEYDRGYEDAKQQLGSQK